MSDQRPPTHDPPPPELRRHLDALPREIEPEHDLWPVIAGRLEPRRPSRFRRLRRTTAGVVPRALAALFFMGLGALVTWLAMSGEPTLDDGQVATTAPPPIATPAAYDVGATTGVEAIEADFLRAREALWRDVLANRDRLQPATVEVVEQNLEIIDRAIRDLRRALEADPGNPALERRLIDSHRRGLDLLRRLSREA